MTSPAYPHPLLFLLLLAPRQTRRIIVWMGDRGITYEQGMALNREWLRARARLRDTYGPIWRWPQSERSRTTWVHFEPEQSRRPGVNPRT